MIAIVALVFAGLGGFIGRFAGCFRACAATASLLLAALAAMNWGLPLGDAIANGSKQAAGAGMLLVFVSVFAVLFGLAVHWTPDPVRAPWLLDTSGGVFAGALAGWILAGMLLFVCRLHRPFDEAVESARSAAPSTIAAPDDFLFRIAETASRGGLKQTPARPFDRQQD